MNENSDKIILHLCASDFGSDSKPYRDAGYDVRLITKDVDVRTYHPPANVYGIIANPPCTMFSQLPRTATMRPRDLREGMELVEACLRVIWECMYDAPQNSMTCPLKFWALENPATGRLRWFLGKPALVYQPWQYGDNMSKETALWGNFNPPLPLVLTQKSSRSNVSKFLPGNAKRSDIRSIASPYFTRAFFLANP
jgi:hypothetical protein